MAEHEELDIIRDVEAIVNGVHMDSSEDGNVDGMLELEAVHARWATILAVSRQKMVAGGVPDCTANIIIRDDNWIFKCRMNGIISETPIPPGAPWQSDG